jgi:hypothetical protein
MFLSLSNNSSPKSTPFDKMSLSTGSYWPASGTPTPHPMYLDATYAIYTSIYCLVYGGTRDENNGF